MRNGARLELSDDQVEFLAEMEHGRYNIERLDAGWQLGERQIRRLASPHLKPWAELNEDIKDYDREAVKNSSTALEELDWGVADI